MLMTLPQEFSDTDIIRIVTYCLENLGEEGESHNNNMAALEDIGEQLSEDSRRVGIALFKAIFSFLKSIRMTEIFGSEIEAVGTKDLQQALDEFSKVSTVETQQGRLVILMRNDLASLTSGRCAAMASHASNQMVFELSEISDANTLENTMSTYAQWSREAKGFGTTIVLSVDEWQMRKYVSAAKAASFHASIVNDPEYALKDGETTHFISVDTCGYIFGRKNDLSYLSLDQLPLMP